MGEQQDLHVTPGERYSGGSSAGYRGGGDLAFTAAPESQAKFPARRLSRITRALFMIAAFFCGWSLLRSSQINVTLSDALLFMAMAIMLSHGEINRRPFGSLTVYWLLGLGLMLLGLLIGTVINGSVDRWLIVCAQYLFAFLLVPMIITGQPITLTRNLPALFMLGIAVSQLIGITASILFDYSDTKDLLGAGFLTGNGRLGAMTGEPNPNGAMIAYSLPILLYSIRQRIIPLGIGLICGVLLVWGLLASGSFTGFVAGLIAVAVYLAISGLGMLVRVAVIGSIGAALFLASGLPLPAAFEKRVAGALSTGDLDEAGTFVGRAELIDEAWELADDNAIVGLGVDQFREVSVQGAPVHEFHLLIWNEGGIVAFVGLVMLLLTLVGAAFVVVSRSRVEGAMILAVVAVFNVYTFSVPHMYSRAWILPVILAMSTYFARRPAAQSLNDQARQNL